MNNKVIFQITKKNGKKNLEVRVARQPIRGAVLDLITRVYTHFRYVEGAEAPELIDLIESEFKPKILDLTYTKSRSQIVVVLGEQK